MKNERILDAIGAINEAAVRDAKAYQKPKTTRLVKWCAVAACLVIAAIALWGGWESLHERGSGGDLGGDGAWQEGVDPIIASIAVIPAGVDLLDVADAAFVSISEEDARNLEPLGQYIPHTLQDGFRYVKAGYYETIMKDGTRYRMIRATYESGAASAPAPTPGNGDSASDMAANTAFLWMVWGFLPDTDLPVYQPEEVSASLIDRQEGGVFYIDYGEIYVGIEQLDISTEDLLAIIESIG